MVSTELQENVQKEEKKHDSNILKLKENLVQCVKVSAEDNTEVFMIELQRPLDLPCLSVEESYDWRQLWFSNVCIFDEKRRKAYMYVWDESIAQRGQAEVASCVLKHILTVVPDAAKKVVQ